MLHGRRRPSLRSACLRITQSQRFHSVVPSRRFGAESVASLGFALRRAPKNTALSDRNNVPNRTTSLLCRRSLARRFESKLKGQASGPRHVRNTVKTIGGRLKENGIKSRITACYTPIMSCWTEQMQKTSLVVQDCLFSPFGGVAMQADSFLN